MSLSKSGPSTLTGKVFMGLDTPGPDEMTLQEIEGKRKLIWDQTTDEEYLARVRQRAQAMAKEILISAQLEAEGLRAEASQKGYREGLDKSAAELQSHIQTMSNDVELMLCSLGSQGSTIWNDRRDDLLQLVHMTIARVLGVEMEQRRAEILEKLLTEGLELLESKREFTILCTERDKDTLEEMMVHIKERNPTLSVFKITVSPKVVDGGVIIETASGKVDNSIDTRMEGVMHILNHLTLANPAETDE